MSLLSLFKTNKNKGRHAQMQEEILLLLKNVSAGKLSGRITNIPKDGSKESAFAWNINDVLDQLEAFMRDVETSVEAAAEGKIYRMTNPEGLHGMFHSTSEKLKLAISSVAVGFETKIKHEVCSKVTPEVPEKPQEIEFYEPSSMIEESEMGGSASCVSNCQSSDSAKEIDGAKILEEPMVQRATELFEATKITIQSKI